MAVVPQRPSIARAEPSGSHFAARLGAGLTGRDTLVHSADPHAIPRALAADFGALLTGVLVMRGADEHKIRRRAANLGARHRQSEMRRSTCFHLFQGNGS